MDTSKYFLSLTHAELYMWASCVCVGGEDACTCGGQRSAVAPQLLSVLGNCFWGVLFCLFGLFEIGRLLS